MIDNTKRSSATYVTKVFICGKQFEQVSASDVEEKEDKMAVTDLDEENEDV